MARTESGVAVNDYLQSVSKPPVYAAGDTVATSGFPLTAVAGMQGAIVASNLLKGNHDIPNYAGIPSVVFTTPPLARVGLTEEAAHAQGPRFATTQEDTSDWYTSRRIALRHTGFKTLFAEGTGRILGAHLLGQHAEELINFFGLAIRSGIKAISSTWCFPTRPAHQTSVRCSNRLCPVRYTSLEVRVARRTAKYRPAPSPPVSTSWHLSAQNLGGSNASLYLCR